MKPEVGCNTVAARERLLYEVKGPACTAQVWSDTLGFQLTENGTTVRVYMTRPGVVVEAKRDAEALAQKGDLS